MTGAGFFYFGCKAAIKRVQSELAHFVEREQARLVRPHRTAMNND